ncbi:DUF7338 family protein [Pseudomonas quasicaspiana]|uniref:DUF7338 family protein n=1 Tax=Pseudomonas quasicaspiana TaxID=2829821 RepID=UPI001E309DAF|nr:hypothetical protein [Pseudomonas quasicaspiana]MCD5980525.1 hypothetical protein [Pseudomonas quasicaspiana]
MKNVFNGAAWLCALCFARIEWVLLLILRLVPILVGLPVVALAVCWPVPGVSLSDGRPIFNVPRWAWLFGNDFDGLDGDKRNWWAENCDALVLFGLLPLLRRLRIAVPPLSVTGWLARWWWAAVRNPVNNMRLLPLFSCPVGECLIECLGRPLVEDKPGAGGFQFVTARRPTGWARWYGLYYVKELTATRALVIRLGFKIRPDHAGNATEAAKGMTFKLNPWKDIS